MGPGPSNLRAALLGMETGHRQVVLSRLPNVFVDHEHAHGVAAIRLARLLAANIQFDAADLEVYDEVEKLSVLLVVFDEVLWARHLAIKEVDEG